MLSIPSSLQRPASVRRLLPIAALAVLEPALAATHFQGSAAEFVLQQALFVGVAATLGYLAFWGFEQILEGQPKAEDVIPRVLPDARAHLGKPDPNASWLLPKSLPAGCANALAFQELPAMLEQWVFQTNDAMARGDEAALPALMEGPVLEIARAFLAQTADTRSTAGTAVACKPRVLEWYGSPTHLFAVVEARWVDGDDTGWPPYVERSDLYLFARELNGPWRCRHSANVQYERRLTRAEAQRLRAGQFEGYAAPRKRLAA